MIDQLQKRRSDVKVDACEDWIKKETTDGRGFILFSFPAYGAALCPPPLPFLSSLPSQFFFSFFPLQFLSSDRLLCSWIWLMNI